MEGTFRCTLGLQAHHAHYVKDHTRSIQQSTSTRTKYIHNFQQQNSNHIQTHRDLFHQTIHKSCQARNKPDITLTTTQVQEAIKQSKNNNKDIDKGTSYKPISLLSVIAKTLEKSLLPYITSNIPNTPMQHGYKTQHSKVTALHTINNTVAKGSAKWLHCSTRYEQSFRHNKHTHTYQKAATDQHSRHNH